MSEGLIKMWFALGAIDLCFCSKFYFAKQI